MWFTFRDVGFVLGRYLAWGLLVWTCVGPGGPAAAEERAYTAEQIKAGNRLYTGQCQLCHGSNGDGIAGVNLAHQQFRTVVTDNDIRRVITTGNPQGMPPFVFKSEELDDLIAFVRSGLDPIGMGFRLGDPVRGKAQYEKAECASCHRIADVGSLIGPDLTDIGIMRRPSQMLMSLTDPDKAMLPINRPVTIVTNEGKTIEGRRFNEDTFSVQLIDSEGQLRSIPKSEIRRYDIGMTSKMPSYGGKLTDADMADLLAYLTSLKG
jgi:putative heme-binding domain-containing protein